MAVYSTRRWIRSDLSVIKELRIRDTRPGPSVRGRHGAGGDPQRQGGAGFRDEEPGETAWDLAEPLSSPAPAAKEQESSGKEQEDSTFPFPVFPGMGGEGEGAPEPSALDIRRLVRGVLKRFWLAAGIAIAIATLFLVAAVTLVKPKWEAVAIVMVHTRQDEFSLGSAKPFESQDYNLKTMLDTIKLPSSLREVSSALQLEVTPRTLGAVIGVRTGNESNLFQITAVWNNPTVAADIANKVAEQLVQRSRDLRRRDAEQAHADYKAQLEAARHELHNVTDRMSAFKATHQVSDFNAETQVLLDSLVRLETELNTKVAETEAMRGALADIEEAVKGEPEMVVTSTVYRNPLKTRLTEYEWQLQEARSRYTEQNPKVIKLQTRVDVLKQLIDESQDEGAPENLYSANTKLVALQDRQRELKSDIRIRDAQIAALSQSVEQTRKKLAALTEAEKDFQLLQQRMSSAENLESTLVGRVEEAKVVMLRNEAAFELFEPAHPPTEPAPSPKKLIVAAGVLLGGMTGLFVVLLLELMDPFVRNRRDALGVPGITLAWELEKVPEGHYALVDATEPGDPIAIFFRRLINDLDAKLDLEDWMCVGVTSAEAEAGRTLAATNFAQALAMKEYPVILVDADLRREAVRRPADLFEIPASRPGLLQTLRDQTPIAALLSTTETPGLSLVTAGCCRAEQARDEHGAHEPPSVPPSTVTAEPAGAEAGTSPTGQCRDRDLPQLGSRRFRAVLDTLRQSGRHLVYDLPPLESHESVLEAAADLGNVMLVARSGQTTRGQLREAAHLVEDRGAKVCGILVTDVRSDELDGVPLFPALDKRWDWRHWLRRSPHAAGRNAIA